MTVDRFLSQFDRKTPTGDQWLVRCPDHDDRQASLAIREGAEGRILLKCHAGCDTSRILHGMGLTEADLFDRETRTTRREVATDGPDPIQWTVSLC